MLKSYDDGTKWMYFLIEDLRYLQAFLKECEVIEKEENVDQINTDDLKFLLMILIGNKSKPDIIVF